MVTRIGHVGLTVPDLDRSIAHAERVMGLRVSERSGSTAYLTCNARHHELVLTQGETAGCDHLAFEVEDAAALESTRERVERHGLELLSGEPQEPGIAGALRFRAPGGFTIEVFHGMACDEPEYDAGGARPRKFEHITLKSSRRDAFEAMLGDVLGMRLSDRVEDQISWWRASGEHHGVSVIRADVDALQHYAWQVDDFSAIGRTGDVLMRHGRQFLWGPGHHGPGDNYFCYFLDDDDVIVEYSAGILRVENEAAYVPGTWPDVPLSVNRWGDPPPPQRFIDGATPLIAPAGVAAGGRA